MPVLFTPRSWRCVACKASGGSLELVAYSLGCPPPVRGQTFHRVREWVNSNAATETPEVAPEPIKRINPLPALGQCRPLYESPEVVAWLESRGISTSAPAGWLPNCTEPWWPTPHWPVVIPACDARGTVQSMHGVAISPDAPRKTTWPRGADSRELLFADSFMRKVLRGTLHWPPRVLFAEGATDYLTAATQMPTIGVSAGAAAALKLVRPPPTTKLYAGTDPDPVGDAYAAQIADALSPNLVYRVPLHRLLG